MTTLHRQIHHARRRLTGNLFFEWLSLGVLLAAGLWAASTLVVRGLALGLPLWHGAWIAAGLAALVAAIGTLLARPSPLRAALALDQAAGLKERLSTALLIQRERDAFAQAAVADAEKAAARIHVPTHLRLRAPQLWPWSLAATVAALILVAFMPDLHLLAAEPEPAETLVPHEQLVAEQQAITAELEKRLAKLEQLPGAAEELKDIDTKIELPEGPGLTPEDIRREAVKKIDAVGEKLNRALEESRQQPLDEMKRMLGQLEPQGGGDKMTRELNEALKSGDFEGARQSLQKLSQELQDAAKNSADPQAQQKLQELQQQLERLADQMAKLGESRQMQKELENKAGLSAEEAEKLLEQLAQMDPKQLQKELQKRLGDKGMTPEQLQQLAQKIQQNQQAKQACKQLAQSLAKAAQACQQCQNPGSAAGQGQAAGMNALSDAASQLSDMEMAEQLMSEMQAQLSDLENLRNSVCEGAMCQGGPGDSNKIGNQGPNYGLGRGARIGKEQTAYKTDPTKARTRPQGGAIIGQMLVDGPQVPGEASAEVMGAARAEVRDALDAIEREEVPRQYRKVLQGYFERLAGLVGETASPAPAPGTGESAGAE